MSNDGATVVPAEFAVAMHNFPGDCITNDKQHGKGEWVWVNGQWTNRIRCMRCGAERVPEILAGKAST